MTEMICRFVVPGYCQPKERTFGRSFVTPPRTRQYALHVRNCATKAMQHKRPFLGFVGVEIEIIHAVPGSWPTKRKQQALLGRLFPTCCDLDNQIKSLSDGMNKVVFEDDHFVNSLVVRREYGSEDYAIVSVYGMVKE